MTMSEAVHRTLGDIYTAQPGSTAHLLQAEKEQLKREHTENKRKTNGALLTEEAVSPLSFCSTSRLGTRLVLGGNAGNIPTDVRLGLPYNSAYTVCLRCPERPRRINRAG